MTAIVSSIALEGVGVGGVERVVGLAAAALVPGDDGEVSFECREVFAHRAHLGATRPTGEEQQHRIVGAVTPRIIISQSVSVDVERW